MIIVSELIQLLRLLVPPQANDFLPTDQMWGVLSSACSNPKPVSDWQKQSYSN